MSQPAIFLDRDGTLVIDQHYPKDPALVQPLPGVETALLKLQKKGYLLFVVSNQSGVGRGLISDGEFQSVHEKIALGFQGQGIQIQEFAYCFHKPEDDCNCRKPATGLITALAKSHELDLSRSYVIGDKWSDIQLAYRSQSTGVLLNSHYPPDKPSELQNVEVPWFQDWTACEKFIPPLHS